MRNSEICVQRIRMNAQLAVLIILASAVVWGADKGPDSFGYKATDSTSYSFVDISATGAAVLNGADDGGALINIGFPFSFYGKSYSSVCASPNGLLSFGGCNPMDIGNQDITATAPAGDLPTIAPLWFDLTFEPQGAGAIHYQTLGKAGSRRFVVQWQHAYILNGSKSLSFQVILQEGDGGILFQYLDIDVAAGSKANSGGLATVGIRDTKGQSVDRALQWSYKVPVLHNEQAILFAPQATCAANVTSQVAVTRGGFLLNRTTNRFVQTITIKNKSTSVIQSPLSLVLDNLSSNATLFNKSGVTGCSAPLNSPYITVSVGSDNQLTPGETATVRLEFTNPSKASITYTTRMLAGANSR